MILFYNAWRINCFDEVLAWLYVWSEVQMICIWPGWCHCHPIISCFIEMQSGLPFWCRLSEIVMEKRSLNRRRRRSMCVCVSVWVYKSGWIDWDAVWEAEQCGSKEPCTVCGPDLHTFEGFIHCPIVMCYPVVSLDLWKWGNCHGCQAACHESDWQTHGDWSTIFCLKTFY